MKDPESTEPKDAWLHGAQVINESGLDTAAVLDALRQAPEVAALTRWAQGIASPLTREGGLFERDKYVTPWNIFDQMRIAYDAIETDDVVSGVLEATESMAFGGMSIDTEDIDEEDVWNQVMEDIELEQRIREMWRELFSVSQFYCVTWWGRKTYKVRGRTKAGVKKKKVFENLHVPLGLTLLDPMKVLPVGNLMFNQERLVYVAYPGEALQFERWLSEGLSDDGIVAQLITGRYEPSEHERRRITELGLPATNMYFLNPENVWRHTATRPQYQRMASVRMKSVFELLDLKQQLKQSDRAHLIGATNFIVLVKKGSEHQPATGAEVAALAAQVKQVARVPLIVGDHRLAVEIITPKLDTVLNGEKYTTIDSRINARLYQMFTVGSTSHGSGRDDSLKLARVVARGMESRRHMLRRSIEKNILKQMFERNDALTNPGELTFHPKRIALDFDPAVATFLQDLRDRGDISRESILEELDFSQATEARNRQREEEFFDGIFETQNPWGGTPAGGPSGQQTMNQAPMFQGPKGPAGAGPAGGEEAAGWCCPSA